MDRLRTLLLARERRGIHLRHLVSRSIHPLSGLYLSNSPNILDGMIVWNPAGNHYSARRIRLARYDTLVSEFLRRTANRFVQSFARRWRQLLSNLSPHHASNGNADYRCCSDPASDRYMK